MNRTCTKLEKCRNSFFAGLVLLENGFPSFVLTGWSNTDWSVFLGPEEIAKKLLLNRPQILSEAIRWTAFPTREGWLCDPYSPEQISEWALEQRTSTRPVDEPFHEYKNWLKGFITKLATVPDALPTISYSNGELSAWIHRRNPDMTTKKIPIQRYEFSPPLPRRFEEERRLFTVSGSEGLNGGWPFKTHEWGVSSGSGFTVPSKGIANE